MFITQGVAFGPVGHISQFVLVTSRMCEERVGEGGGERGRHGQTERERDTETERGSEQRIYEARRWGSHIASGLR